MTKATVEHVFRFGITLGVSGMIPIYSLTRLPFASVARFIVAAISLLFCLGATLGLVWSLIQKVAACVSNHRRHRTIVGILALGQCIALPVIGELMTSPHFLVWSGGAAAVAALLSGAWAMGGLLQRLWAKSEPVRPGQRPPSSSSFYSLSRTPQRKGVSRA